MSDPPGSLQRTLSQGLRLVLEAPSPGSLPEASAAAGAGSPRPRPRRGPGGGGPQPRVAALQRELQAAAGGGGSTAVGKEGEGGVDQEAEEEGPHPLAATLPTTLYSPVPTRSPLERVEGFAAAAGGATGGPGSSASPPPPDRSPERFVAAPPRDAAAAATSETAAHEPPGVEEGEKPAAKRRRGARGALESLRFDLASFSFTHRGEAAASATGSPKAPPRGVEAPQPPQPPPGLEATPSFRAEESDRALLALSRSSSEMVAVEHASLLVARAFRILRDRGEGGGGTGLGQYVAWGLLALEAFETPRWCVLKMRAGDPTVPGNLHAWHSCGGKDGFYHLTGHAFFPRWAVLGVEAALLFVLMVLALHERGKAYSKWDKSSETFKVARMWSRKRRWTYRALWAVAVVDAVVAAALPPGACPRLGALVRVPLLVVGHEPGLRRQMKVFWSGVLPQLFAICVILSVHLLGWSWVGYLLFEKGFDEEHSRYFKDLATSLWTVLISFTTANFPDAVVLAYDVDRRSALFYVPYMILSVFLLSNIFTAIIFKSWEDEMLFERARLDLRAKTLFDEAFDELERNSRLSAGYVDKALLKATLDTLHLQTHMKQLISSPYSFNLMDGVLNRHDFYEVFHSLQGADSEDKFFWPSFSRRHPHVTSRFVLSAAFLVEETKYFEVLINCVVGLNCAVFIVENLFFQEADIETEGLHSVWNILDIPFAVFYVAEAAVKIYVLGWRRYFKPFRGKFDFLTTLSAVVAMVIVYVPNAIEDFRLIKFVLMLRTLRFFRLALVYKPFLVVAETVMDSIPSGFKLMKVLVLTMAIFATVGQLAFGGKVSTDPASPHYAVLKGMDYAANDYWSVNFNDFPASFLTLFALLIVNNWFLFADAFVAVTHVAFRLYFGAFYIVGVLFMLNIVVAFIIDLFMSEFAKHGTARRRFYGSFARRVWEEQGPGIENISLFANLQRTTSLERRSTSAGLQTPLLSGALSSGGWPGNTAGHAPEAPRFAPGYS